MHFGGYFKLQFLSTVCFTSSLDVLIKYNDTENNFQLPFRLTQTVGSPVLRVC